MTTPQHGPSVHDDRSLLLLQRLLSIKSSKLRPALTKASDLIAEAFGADKVDVFVYDPTNDSLVALGTWPTPMGERQHALGPNCQPVSNLPVDSATPNFFLERDLRRFAYDDLQVAERPRPVCGGAGVVAAGSTASAMHRAEVKTWTRHAQMRRHITC